MLHCVETYLERELVIKIIMKINNKHTKIRKNKNEKFLYSELDGLIYEETKTMEEYKLIKYKINNHMNNNNKN